ncbi:MAG TPA: hypothetical protein VF039_06285 [Longimicrobiales bacterium]
MRLVELLLPVRDNDGVAFGREPYDAVRRELTDAFGGVTAHLRAPAAGLWDEGDEVVRDDIVIFEVMVDDVDARWWRDYRVSLERRFRQDEIVIRALPMERI